MTVIPERGLKHTCANCETRFYDMSKTPITCPKCSHIVIPVVKKPARPRRRAAGELDAPVVAPTQATLQVKYKPVKWKN